MLWFVNPLQFLSDYVGVPKCDCLKFIYLLLLLLCLHQGDDKSDSVEEDQLLLVLDMSHFIELVLSVKRV